MRYIIVDCGAIGLELARRWGQAGQHVIGTTPDPARLPEIAAVCAEAVELSHDDAARTRELAADADGVVLAVRPALEYTRSPRERVIAIRSMIGVVRAAASVQRRLVLFSSLAVYGDAAGDSDGGAGPVTERAPVTTSLDPAGQGFAAVERVVLQTRRGAVLRLPDTAPVSSPDLLRRLREQIGDSLPYDGAALAHMIDPRDAAAAVAFVVAQELIGVYNVVPDEVVPPRLDAYLGKLAAEAGLPPFTLTGALKAPNRPVSSAKLRAAGFEFRHG
jgi:nucleoside-diphosphate-sugar epimerase